MNLKKTIEFLHGMSSIRRYSQTKLVNEESVLEHTGFVGCISYFIARELQRNGMKIDMGVLFEKAMLHDMEEVIVGDIPRPTKYATSHIKLSLEQIEKEAMMQIEKDVSVGELRSRWALAKDGAEGAIVASADAIAVVYKAYQEIHIFGNKAIANHIKGLKESIECLIDEINFDELSKDLELILEEALGLLIDLEEEL